METILELLENVDCDSYSNEYVFNYINDIYSEEI